MKEACVIVLSAPHTKEKKKITNMAKDKGILIVVTGRRKYYH